MSLINISGYAFFAIPQERLGSLRTELKTLTRSLGLKGSILIAEEGANAFLSGTREMIDTIILALRETFGFPDMSFKESPGEYQPFSKMLVKIKTEIISMGCPHIKPAEMKAPYVKPKELKQWLDDGKDLIILDTRNDYEVALGKFEGAIDLNIDHFRAFPAAIEALPEDFKSKTVVTYCTGGIRCEKAAPFLMSVGFKDVYQIEGGILKYFEECGSDHYEGECFVFDKRVAVDSTLEQTSTIQCFACRMPLTEEEQKSEHYKISEHCPKCVDARA